MDDIEAKFRQYIPADDTPSPPPLDDSRVGSRRVTPRYSSSRPRQEAVFLGPPELEWERKKKDYFRPVVYKNTLPDIPLDPKHLTLPIHLKDFEIEQEDLACLYDQIPGRDCGITVDLVGSVCNWEVPEDDDNIELHEDDKMLLEFHAGEEKKVKRENAHKKKVPWLRCTEYISCEAVKSKTNQERGIAKERQLSHKTDDGLTKYKTAKDVLANIERTFEDAQKPITEHFDSRRKGVFVKEILPVFPDEELWKHCFTQVIFRPSPSVSGTHGELSEAQMKAAFIKGFTFDVRAEDEDGEESAEDVVGYFIPNTSQNETASFDDSKEYVLVRDYTSKMKDFHTGENYFSFQERNDKITYCGISTRVQLNPSNKVDSKNLKNIKLSIKHRPLNEDEIKFENERSEIMNITVSESIKPEEAEGLKPNAMENDDEAQSVEEILNDQDSKVSTCSTPIPPSVEDFSQLSDGELLDSEV